MVENPVRQIVDGRETEHTFRERQETVADLLRLALPARRQRVVAEDVVTLDAPDFGFVVQLVRMPESIATGENQAAAWCSDQEFVGRTIYATVASFDVLDTELELCRKPVGPERE